MRIWLEDTTANVFVSRSLKANTPEHASVQLFEGVVYVFVRFPLLSYLFDPLLTPKNLLWQFCQFRQFDYCVQTKATTPFGIAAYRKMYFGDDLLLRTK